MHVCVCECLLVHVDHMVGSGSGNGAFLSEEAQCGGPLGRAPLPWTLEDMFRKAQDTGISLHRGPVGEPGGDLLARTLREKDSTVYSQI